jgi:hypothetical protein
MKRLAKIAALLYVAQASIGFTIGLVYPWLVHFGMI